MCIEYRVVNGFIQLSNYPLPLIDDLLIGFESATWFMSLKMASGLWAIRMTEHAKLISAFVCPFGHFQWLRMPFGLKNAPSVYQAVINNCLWGFVRLSPEEEVEVVQDVLEFLGLDPSKREESGSQVSALTDTVTVFQRNIPAPDSMGPVLGRSSYIDNIAHGAPTWDQLCDDLDALLFRLRYWNISVSLPKSEFGKLSIPYLLPVVAIVLYELSDDQVRSERDLIRAKAAFEILKTIVSTPLQRHPDRSKPFVTIPHANRWAACAVLGQGYDRKIQPVRLTGRVLNKTELRFHIAEKEVIAVLRVLQVFRALLEGYRLEVYTRHFVQVDTPFEDGRQTMRPMGRHALALGYYCPILDDTYQGIVLSFDGAAKTSTRRGSCGCILLQLPGWKESRWLDRQVENLVVVGDSRIVIQQVQGLINCHHPNLHKHLAECEVQKEKFQTLRLVHVKREYNKAADYLTSKPLTLGKSWIVQDPEELLYLERVSKIAEKLMKPKAVLLDGEPPQDSERLGLPQGSVGVREDVPPDEEKPRRPMTPLEYQAERWRRIRVHQEQDIYLSEIKSFLKGDIGRFSPRRLRQISKVADLFALDARDVLYRLACSTRGRPRDFVDEPRIVIPDSLRSDMLHYAHDDFQGGHQSITRTYEKLRSEFYWPGMCADVEPYVKECVDCASGKGRPPNEGPSSGNIEPRRPFEVVSMDFVTHMPESERGNTFLLLFQDAFSGFVMCKPMRSTTAQDVAEVYEECVFRRFGASSMVRHDQDPRFMSEVFTRFRELLGSKH
ncbi:unnamed protein product [Phytophthora fragariaefolia]|uniref:Unnamed protein product n=1 Tax=Phytophthora fragariaefolia TaxID=1490495 RepID=A0A9W7CS64_9STRA|nr:unnamed protein product [Phytophthora fragariaefolia]